MKKKRIQYVEHVSKYGVIIDPPLSDYDFCYLVGLYKPNYPVPAIRTYHQWGWTYDWTRMTYRMALRRTTGWVKTKNKWWYSTIYRDNVDKTGWQGKRY